MQLEERQARMMHYLQKVEFASLEELSNQVDVSVSTVRRDLTMLEAAGVVKRTHGGARLSYPRSDEFKFSARTTQQQPEKEAIAKACVQLLEPNQTVILDAGSTVFNVAQHIEDKLPHIITNSLPIANLFGGTSRLEVVLSGGVIYPRLGVLVGPLAVETFSKVRADVAIMSGGGISLDGISNSHGLLIDIQRAMINAVQKVIFCLDHTKFGRGSVLPLCELDVVDAVVTDSKAPTDLLEALRLRGIQVVVGVESTQA
jgi:DeoR family transcriptional regulator, fructose operon transcriptional repressor